MTQYLWLFWLPLLFLPNLGFGSVTTFGTVELSDLLIWPYLLLLLLAPSTRQRTLLGKSIPFMLLFVVWAAMVTVLITLRFRYQDNQDVIFGLLKLAKFTLYGVAGILTSRALVNEDVRRRFTQSMVVAGLIVGIGLFAFGQKSAQSQMAQYAGYKASNEVSVRAAILACYVAGVRLQRTLMSRSMHRLALIAILALALGMAISEGRGGWLAAIAGMLYLGWTGISRRGTMALMVGIPVFACAMYFYSPVFRHRVTVTFFPETVHLQPGVGGVDDGARPMIFRESLKQLTLLGTGFFHRGDESGIYQAGSHNFFLQMFLETGVTGGILMLLIVFSFWHQAGSAVAKTSGFAMPVKAALLAAIVGAQGGEYFYGGMGLFSLLAVYAACGSLPIWSPVRVPVVRSSYAQSACAR